MTGVATATATTSTTTATASAATALGGTSGRRASAVRSVLTRRIGR
ncbi:hypothetical protein ACFXPV_06500 [Streptomyces sp. NPDC059118]|uniref:Uncharacterized protein n=1 Tax=Streptomyces pulveraceus TaxID=68258 RepID=A0ABW1GJT0_9ACTN